MIVVGHWVNTLNITIRDNNMSNDNEPTVILTAAITTVSGNVTRITEDKTFQAFLTGSSGALTATVDIEVSNDGIHFVQGASLDLTVAAWSTVADDDTDGFFSDELLSWAYIRARVITITGTDAAVTVIIGK